MTVTCSSFIVVISLYFVYNDTKAMDRNSEQFNKNVNLIISDASGYIVICLNTCLQLFNLESTNTQKCLYIDLLLETLWKYCGKFYQRISDDF